MFKNKIVSLFLLSLWITLLYSVLVVDFSKQHPLFRFSDTIALSSPQVECSLDLEPDHYLLKIIYKVHDGRRKTVIFNDEIISVFQVRRKGEKETDYFHIRPEQIRRNNSLKIDFAPDFPEKVKIKLQNYRHAFIANSVIAFFRPSLVHLVEFSPLRTITVFLLSSLFFAAVVFGFEKSHRRKAMPTLIIFSMLLTGLAISNFLPFTPHVVFTHPLFFWSCYVLVAFVMFFTLAYKLSNEQLSKETRTVVPGIIRVLNFIFAKTNFKPINTVFWAKRKACLELTFVPFLIALILIGKLFLSPGLFPYDYADDANHVFPNFEAVKSCLEHGELPLINLYNNFGTPILGDCLTFPFSLNSVVYYLFDGPVAEAIKRFAVTFLLLVLLIKFLKQYMSVFGANISAILCVASPGLLWHLGHHHYQYALLGFVIILHLQKRFTDKHTIANYFLLVLAFAHLVLSTSIMMVFIAMPFIVVYQYFIGGRKFSRELVLLFPMFVSGFIVLYPDTYTFMVSMLNSSRVLSGYHNLGDFTTKEILLRLAGLLHPLRHHIQVAIFYSIPTLVLLAIGIRELLRSKKDRNLGILVGLLGILPFLTVLFLLRFSNIWFGIPLVGSTDISRVLWLSNTFMMISVGVGLDSLKKIAKSQAGLIILTTIWICIILLYLLLGWNKLAVAEVEIKSLWGLVVNFRLPVYVMFATSAAGIIVLKLRKYPVLQLRFPKTFHRIFGVCLLAAVAPLFLYIGGIYPSSPGSHRWGTLQATSFNPISLLDSMQPYSRLVTDIHSVEGQELRAIYGKVFGSSGRSVLLYEPLSRFLENEKLIEVEKPPRSQHYAYHFTRPWKTDKLSELGIRYVITAGLAPELQKDMWRQVNCDTYHEQMLYLYENPSKATIAYVQDDGKRTFIQTENMEFSGNGILIKLPPIAKPLRLIAAFSARPGWKAFVDGRPKTITSSENTLIEIGIKNGDKMVELKYAPFGWHDVIIGLVIALSIVYSSYIIVNRNGCISARKNS